MMYVKGVCSTLLCDVCGRGLLCDVCERGLLLLAGHRINTYISNHMNVCCHEI